MNPAENVREFLRTDFLSHRVWQSCEAIVDASCNAWYTLMQMPERIASIPRRSRAIQPAIGSGGWSNNAADRATRSPVPGRRNGLFCGSDAAGRRAARISTIIEACKLNGVDPQVYLTDVLGRSASTNRSTGWMK
jgi:hypothetical protein